MWNLSYTACSFVVREKYKGGEYRMDLNDTFISTENSNQKYDNILDVFSKYCNMHNKLLDKKEEKRLFKINLLERSSDDDIEYLLIEIESGKYGYKSKITDKDTQKVAYNQKETDAPLMNFYLTILVPKRKSTEQVYKGFMFFQNYGQYGVKTETINGMRKFFSEEFDLTLWVGNISPDIFVEKVMTSDSIRKVYFIKNNISSDLSDSLKFTYGREQKIIEKIKVTPQFMSKLHGYMKGHNRIFEFENTNYDDVKVDLDMGGRNRIIGLNNIENVSIIESLPNDLKDEEGDIDTKRLLNIICVQTKEYMKRIVYCS